MDKEISSLNHLYKHKLPSELKLHSGAGSHMEVIISSDESGEVKYHGFFGSEPVLTSRDIQELNLEFDKWKESQKPIHVFEGEKITHTEHYLSQPDINKLKWGAGPSIKVSVEASSDPQNPGWDVVYSGYPGPNINMTKADRKEADLELKEWKENKTLEESELVKSLLKEGVISPDGKIVSKK